MRNRRARVKIATREEKREAEEKKMRLFFWGGGGGHYSQSNVESFYYERKLPTPDKNKQCVGFQTKKFWCGTQMYLALALTIFR